MFKPKRYTHLMLVLVMLAAMVPVTGAQTNTVLTVRVPTGWEQRLSDDVIAHFEDENPGVQVEVDFVGGPQSGGFTDFETIAEDMQEYAESSDVLYLDSQTLSVPLTRAGFVLDLTPLVTVDSSLTEDDFYPGMLESFAWDGGQWAIPFAAQPILVYYDPAAFDEAGLTYPDENWTAEQYANAARALSHDEDGTHYPGLTVGFGGELTPLLFRTLLDNNFADTRVSPEIPLLTTNEDLQQLMELWGDLIEEGAVHSGGVGGPDDIPLRIGPLFLFTGFQQERNMEIAPLPGGVTGLQVEGFAVSSGTQYPQEAYALASFLSRQPEVVSDFFTIFPARRSLQNSDMQSLLATLPEDVQDTLTLAIENTIPASETRFGRYVLYALFSMTSDGLDPLSSLQSAEMFGIKELQDAAAFNENVTIVVQENEAANIPAGELRLNVGLGLAGPNGSISFGGSYPGQPEWESLTEAFAGQDPQVAFVDLELANGGLAEIGGRFDCFTLNYNATNTGENFDTLLPLDPFLNADPDLNLNDMLPTVLDQLQANSQTWGLPLAIQTDKLLYNVDLFARAGLPAPTDGWTIDEFVLALETLHQQIGETPFTVLDPSGGYIFNLIAAYGGIPLDYSTDPPTVNFTDPQNVEAIRQTLDLARSGYWNYSELAGNSFSFSGGPDQQFALVTHSVQGGGPIMPGTDLSTTPYQSVLYPRGSERSGLSYTITAGYISAGAENPEACYLWLKFVSESAFLFDGMPVQGSLVQDPAIQQRLDVGTVEAYEQLNTLLADPNTVVFPAQASYVKSMTEIWLKRAMDNYVLRDADLATELATAEQMTRDFLNCIDGVDLRSNAVFECAVSVDPSFAENR